MSFAASAVVRWVSLSWKLPAIHFPDRHLLQDSYRLTEEHHGPPSHRTDRSSLYWSAAIIALSIFWAILGLVLPSTWLSNMSLSVHLGIEAISTLARLFGALVLFLLPSDHLRYRLRWVAAGFLVLAMGSLVFGYTRFLAGFDANIDGAMYAGIMVRTFAGVLFVIGLLMQTPRPFTHRTMLLILGVFAVCSVVVMFGAHVLPRLVYPYSGEDTMLYERSFVHSFSLWYVALSLVPLALSLVSLVEVIRHQRAEQSIGWLIIAMTLFVVMQFHSIFWPSLYTTMLTSADVFRFVFTVVIAVAGIIELRRMAVERAELLASERETTRRLTELSKLKADFTAMVAHELTNPLATIHGFADILATYKLNPDQQAEALMVIQSEAQFLATLVADLGASASIERTDFVIKPRPVPLDGLINEVVIAARSLSGQHPVSAQVDPGVVAWADPDRTGQVLRNLLGNAAKYSPPGTPIEVRATRKGNRVCIEVVDQGNGISEEDICSIFEKFRRGRDEDGHKAPGLGLGLYLSRRIIQAQGSDIAVRSTPSVGSTFSFELEVCL